MKVSELAALPPKLLIYSRAGLGKSALAMTLGEDCLYHDLDDNMEVAFGLRDQFFTDRQCVEVKQFLDDDPKRPTAFKRFKAGVYSVSDQIRKGDFEYKYYVVDSLTSIAMAAQHMVMANNSKAGENPQIQHWGVILNEILNIITTIRALPICVLVLAHEMIYTSEDQNVVQLAISGQKLPGQITRLFNEIWYLRAKPGSGNSQDLYIQSVPSSSVTCRSGRGLPTGTRFATITKEGQPKDSVGMKTLLDRIQRKDKKEATPSVVSKVEITK